MLCASRFPGRLPKGNGEGRIPEPGLLAKQQTFPEAARASCLPDESGYLTEGNQLVAIHVAGYMVDQLDWKLAERVMLYVGDFAGERLFDAFSFLGGNKIADQGAGNGKLLQGVYDVELGGTIRTDQMTQGLTNIPFVPLRQDEIASTGLTQFHSRRPGRALGPCRDEPWLDVEDRR